jgi:hypothetical protein
MGEELIYRDGRGQPPVIDIERMQQHLADVDEAILLAQRIQQREGELVRIYTDLSDNLAPKPTKMLPRSTITDYAAHSSVNETTVNMPQPFIEPDRKFKREELTQWGIWGSMFLVGTGLVLGLIWFIVTSILNALGNLANGVQSWWAASGDTVLGTLAIIVIVILVLLFKGGGKNFTFSGTGRLGR